MQRANHMQETTQQATTRTEKMYNEVKQKTDEAVEGYQSSGQDQPADRVDPRDSSSQTSLLALNASI